MVRILKLLYAVSVFAVIFSTFSEVCAQTGESTACQDADVLSDTNRHFSEGNTNRCDDNLVTKWYRFELNGHPAEIPTTCIMNQHCGTQVPLHLDTNGRDLPDVNQTAKFYVCASYNVLGKWDCCVLRKPVHVKNCGGYYVYYLHPPDRCPVGYCVKETNQRPFSNITVKTGEHVHASDNPGHSSSEINVTSGTSTAASGITTEPSASSSPTTSNIATGSSDNTSTESSVFNVTNELSSTSISQTSTSITNVTSDSTISSISNGNNTSSLDLTNLTTTQAWDDTSNETTTQAGGNSSNEATIQAADNSSNETTTTTTISTIASTSSVLPGSIKNRLSNGTDELIGFNQTCGDSSTQFVCGNNSCFQLSDHIEILCRVNTTHMACVQACNTYPDCDNGEDEHIGLCSNGGCAEGQQYCQNRQGCFSDCSVPRVIRILTLNISGENHSKSSEKIQSPTINRDSKMAILEGFNESSVYINQNDLQVVNTSVVGAGNSTLELTVLLNVTETVAIDEPMALLRNDSFLDLVASLLFKDEGDTNSTMTPTTQLTNSTSSNSSLVFDPTSTTVFPSSIGNVTLSNQQSIPSTVQSEASTQMSISSQSTSTSTFNLITDTPETLPPQLQTDTPLTNSMEMSSTSQSYSSQTMTSSPLTETNETQTFIPETNPPTTSQTSIPTSPVNPTTSLVLTTLFLEQSSTITEQADSSKKTNLNITASQTSTSILDTSMLSTVVIPSTGISQASEPLSTTDIPVNITVPLHTEELQQTMTQLNNLTIYSNDLTTVEPIVETSEISTSEISLRTSTQHVTESHGSDTETTSVTTVAPTLVSVNDTFPTTDLSSEITSSSVETSPPETSVQMTMSLTTETSERVLTTAAAQTSESVPTTIAERQRTSPLSTLSEGRISTSTYSSSTTNQTNFTPQSTHTSINTEPTTSVKTTDMVQTTDSSSISDIYTTEIRTSPTTIETKNFTSSSSSTPTIPPSTHVPSSVSVEHPQTTKTTASPATLTTTILTMLTTTHKHQYTSQSAMLETDTTALSKETTTNISDIQTSTFTNVTNIQKTDSPAVDDDHEIIVFFKQNQGLFIFVVVASVAMLGICVFGIGGTIYQRRMRTWSPEDILDDTYPDMEKSMISIGREGSGVESTIPDVDIIQSEQTGEGESLSKASTLVCRSPADRLQGTSTGSPDTPINGTCKEVKAGFPPLNGHANEAYQSDESIDLDGITPYEELDEKPPRNMFPWIDTAEDTKV